MTVAELDAPEITAQADDRWATFLAKGEVVLESVHRRGDGTLVPVELNVRLIERDGQRLVLTVARDISERKRAEEELRRLNAEVVRLATVAERDRISRELHDGLAQVLGYLSLKGEAAQIAIRTGQLAQAERSVNEIIEVAQRSYAEVREAILDLRTHITQGVGLQAVLDDYLHRFTRDFGIETRLVVANDDSTRFSPAVEVQLLRIVQEALTNVRRHSGAHHTAVRFEGVAEGRCQVVVEDDGQGFEPSEAWPKSFGLQSMRERAESVGGTIEVASCPGQGTTVVVILPQGL
jgi:signal transduction histidine kinase